MSTTLRRRQRSVPRDIVDASWRAQERLNYRYRHLAGRLGRPIALTAVARELAGFVWAVGHQVEVVSAA